MKNRTEFYGGQHLLQQAHSLMHTVHTLLIRPDTEAAIDPALYRTLMDSVNATCEAVHTAALDTEAKRVKAS